MHGREKKSERKLGILGRLPPSCPLEEIEKKKLTSTSTHAKKKKKQSLHGRTLSGRRILQADEVVNAAASAKHR